MSEQANTEVIERLYDAFSRGDVGTVMSCLDPGANLYFEGAESVPWTGEWRGHEGWGRFFQTLAENTDSVAIQMEIFAAQGNNVAAVGRYQAQVKSTGKRIDSPLVHLWTVENGVVTKCVEYTNSAAELDAFTG